MDARRFRKALQDQRSGPQLRRSDHRELRRVTRAGMTICCYIISTRTNRSINWRLRIRT